MSLGSLTLVGVIADSQFISGSAPPPASVIFFASLSSTTTADLSDGSPNELASSAITFASNFATFPNAGSFVRWPAASNWPSTRSETEGCLRMVVEPVSSDTNSARHIVFNAYTTVGGSNNSRWTIGREAASWHGFLWNSGGTLVHNFSWSTDSIVAGSVYEIELNWENFGTASATTYFFIQGIAASSVFTGSIANNTDASVLWLAQNTDFTDGWSGGIKNLRVFSTTQHVVGSNYTPAF